MHSAIEPIKGQATKLATLLKHNIRWGEPVHGRLMGNCIDCLLPLAVFAKPRHKQAPQIEGLALSDHCDSKPLCFREAHYLFSKLPRGANSLLLRPDTRLVELSLDMYAVQLCNTYIIRISQSGVFLLNTRGRRTPDVLELLNRYTPVQLEMYGSSFVYTDTRREFQDGDTIDSSGTYLPPLRPAVRQKLYH